MSRTNLNSGEPFEARTVVDRVDLASDAHARARGTLVDSLAEADTRFGSRPAARSHRWMAI